MFLLHLSFPIRFVFYFFNLPDIICVLGVIHCRANAILDLTYKRLTNKRLTIDCSKTENMLLSPKPYKLSSQGKLLPIELSGNVLTEVNKFKFLGLHLPNNIKWSTHIY